jgi:hypothetical protein
MKGDPMKTPQKPVDNDVAFNAIRAGSFASYLETDALSLRNMGILLGDDANNSMGPRHHEQMLCTEAQAGRLDVDYPGAAQAHATHLQALQATRSAVARWLRAHGTAEHNAGRLAAWALYNTRG